MVLPDDDSLCVNIFITNCLMEKAREPLPAVQHKDHLITLRHGHFGAEAEVTPSLSSQPSAARRKQFQILKKPWFAKLCCVFCMFKLLTGLFKHDRRVPCR